MDSLAWASNWVCDLFRLRNKSDDIQNDTCFIYTAKDEELLTDDEDDEIIVDGVKRSRHSCVSCREPRPTLKRSPSASAGAQAGASQAAKQPKWETAAPEEQQQQPVVARGSAAGPPGKTVVLRGRDVDAGLAADFPAETAATTIGMDVKEPAEYADSCCPDVLLAEAEFFKRSAETTYVFPSDADAVPVDFSLARRYGQPENAQRARKQNEKYFEEAAPTLHEHLVKTGQLLKHNYELPSTSKAARVGKWETFEEDDSPEDCSQFSEETRD